MRVLVVDDHEEALAAICELLEAHGHDVVGVTRGSAAVDACTARTPDLVLVDVRLGEESGFSVARALVTADPGLRVILMSMNRADPEAVCASGARALILKDELATIDLGVLARR
jgi:DNA-binding response OmpR family regulator